MVIGAILAGGAGSRLGSESKPALPLAGRPLVSYPAQTLATVCDLVAVVCKRHTVLPDLPGTERWEEPDEPLHPLTGIVHALERAGAPVLVCAADMPFVTADACRSLMQAVGASTAAVATAAGVLQPVLGLYAPAALAALRAAPLGDPLTRTVEALEPARVALPPPMVLSVNTAEQLEEAEAILRGT